MITKYTQLDTSKFVRCEYGEIQEFIESIPDNTPHSYFKQYSEKLIKYYRSIYLSNPHVCGCNSQYYDWYVKIALYMRKHTKEDYDAMLARVYHIVRDKSVIFEGESYNETNLTDEIAERILSQDGITQDTRDLFVKTGEKAKIKQYKKKVSK